MVMVMATTDRRLKIVKIVLRFGGELLTLLQEPLCFSRRIGGMLKGKCILASRGDNYVDSGGMATTVNFKSYTALQFT